MSSQQHRHASAALKVKVAVITMSDTRTVETDKSGALMKSMLESADFEVVHYALVKDDAAQIRTEIEYAATVADVVLTNGGTGISKRDSTFEVVSAMLEKTLPGFGELFRMLSYHEIGAAAMLSRATAGVYRNTLVFCTPGSTNAVQLAMEKLIVPELRHLVWELIRQNS